MVRCAKKSKVTQISFCLVFLEYMYFYMLFLDMAIYCSTQCILYHRAGRDDVTTGKLFPSRGECLGLYRCVLIIFKRK